MNSKPMLFECIECEETYLADNLCDGYRCPKCDGFVVGRGFIKEIEESVKDMQNKINKAKENGLIRKYTKPLITNLPYIPCDGHIAELHLSEYICGVDLGNGKDSTAQSLECIYKSTIKIKDVRVKRMKEELSYLVTYDRAFDSQHRIIINSDRYLSNEEIKEILHQNCPACEQGLINDVKDFTVTISLNHEKMQETIDNALAKLKEDIRKSAREGIGTVM